MIKDGKTTIGASPTMRFNILSLILLLQLACVALVCGQDPTPVPSPKRLLALENDAELRELYLNINQKCIGRLSGEMWTLTHAYESKEEVDRVLNYFIDFFKAIESDSPKQIEKLEGAKGFKISFGSFLDSKDEAVRAFSSFVLGCAGDKSYAPKIAKIVNERDESFNDRFSGKRTFARGRAAIALGSLQATDYKLDIAKLLKSKNESDRSGAIFALADMRALEFTNEIVGILTKKEFAFDDDDSPIYFLIETRQASNFKKEIVQAMLGESLDKVPESAAYALVAIGAKEHGKDIARLLKDEYRSSDAARALALLGATEYADEIATMLTARSGLRRRAALTALAILNSKKHIPQIIKSYRSDPESYVRPTAAEALLLMGFPAYYKELISLNKSELEPPKLLEIDFHPFMLDMLVPLNQRLSDNLRGSEKHRVK